MDYLSETPEPTKELVIILITALTTVMIVGVFFFQIGMEAVDDKNSIAHETDSLKLVKQQLKLLKRQLRSAMQDNNELKASLAIENILINQRKRTVENLEQKERHFRKQESIIVNLNNQILALQSSVKSQKIMLDSCLAIR